MKSASYLDEEKNKFEQKSIFSFLSLVWWNIMGGAPHVAPTNIARIMQRTTDPASVCG